MKRDLGGVIWTDHALQRLRERGIKQGDAWATFNRPDQSRYAKSKGAWIYYKNCGNQKIEVVAKKNEKGEWIILTVWSRPIFESKTHNSSKTSSDSFLLKLLKKIFKVN